MTDPTELLAALRGAAAAGEDPHETASNGETSWARAGTRFAVLRGATVELRVGSVIVSAALRTPDTTRSERGPDWIAFAPSDLDGPARDRLVAWFAAAGRRAVN
jgi:hypothetical protein